MIILFNLKNNQNTDCSSNSFSVTQIKCLNSNLSFHITSYICYQKKKKKRSLYISKKKIKKSIHLSRYNSDITATSTHSITPFPPKQNKFKNTFSTNNIKKQKKKKKQRKQFKKYTTIFITVNKR